jgi:hypothetical protein
MPILCRARANRARARKEEINAAQGQVSVHARCACRPIRAVCICLVSGPWMCVGKFICLYFVDVDSGNLAYGKRKMPRMAKRSMAEYV